MPRPLYSGLSSPKPSAHALNSVNAQRETGCVIDAGQEGRRKEEGEEEDERRVRSKQDADDQARLSDVDDDEIDSYIRSSEEAVMRETTWNALNRDYIEKQARPHAPVPLGFRLRALGFGL
jgi:hypothetical protein